MEDFCHQLHGRIVGIVPVLFIEYPQLLQVLELIHLVFRLTVDVHFGSRVLCHGRNVFSCRSIQQVCQNLFPVHLLGSGGLIIFFQHGEKLLGKFPGKVNRSVHDPGIRAAYGHSGEQPLFAGLQAPFRGGAFHIYRRIPCAALVCMVHVFADPVIGG